MNTLRHALRTFLRDLRAGELSVLLVAIVVAVTAITAVGFFTDRVGRGMLDQASAILAADLVIRSPTPIDARYLREARELGLETAESVSFPTVVLAGDESTLAVIDAVSDTYPLRGELRTARTAFGASRVADGIPAPGEIWAEPGLLGRLGLDVGDTLRVGDRELLISLVLQYKPDQNIGFINLAPGALMNLADVPALNVIREGSRVTWLQMFAGDPAVIERFRARIAPELSRDASLRGRENAGEQINAAIDRAQRFLTLASLVTVILAAIAAAMAARRYALRHLDTVALLKTLGATQRQVAVATSLQLALIIVLTAGAGLALGWFAQYGLAWILAEFVGFPLPAGSNRPILLGLATSATVVLGFAMPQLFALRTTPPLRVLRRDLPPPQLSARVIYGAAMAALLLLVLLIVQDLLLVLLIGGGLVLVGASAALSGWLLVRMLTRFRGAAGIAWRYGLANIARRGPESVVQIVAFGLSLMVLLLLGVVRGDLLQAWQQTVPDEAPNQFMINIGPEQHEPLREFLYEELGRYPFSLPLIRGRMTHINDVPVDNLRFPDPQGSSFVQRETNLTWSGELPASNRVTAGRWWGEGHDGPPEVSIDQRLAENLGIGLGDRLRFSVGGEAFEGPVTSVRGIEWDSLQPNFFVMLSPGLASELPHTWLSSIYVPPERLEILNRLVREFPGVTVLDLEVILAQVRTVIERGSQAIQYVFLFTVLAGVLVLLAAVQMTGDERRFESAILHALGARRGIILRGVAVEFVALGALAGLLAALGATLVGWLLATYAFNLSYELNLMTWAIGLAAGAIIVGLTGTLATRHAVQAPPVTVLREG
ncbi:MAG: ABC transporter permease [Chromatiales bacterium]|nr:ABC transporter permease [Chromatiales bacterium]